MNTELISWIVLTAPLAGAILTGIFGCYLKWGRAYWAMLFSITTSLVGVGLLDWRLFVQHQRPWHVNGFAWLSDGHFLKLTYGLWVDHLTLVMMTMVLGISLVVHLYSIAYMKNEAGYQRFFSYIGLFTFFMLTLVSADNFFQLFFGWELVGFMSYVLIGFWFDRPVAKSASLNAFLINRIGDVGLLLAIVLLFKQVHNLDYQYIFQSLPKLQRLTISLLGQPYSLLAVISGLLFMGAMTKSAQMPFQMWLPDAMAGPTPASALMHAATMVTAGIYMIIRLSPLFEYTTPFVKEGMLIIGATTAVLGGWVALTQQDIKRIIAFSTISQLGYMTAALGVSAYNVALFHLVTHAVFKALLFLSAGSVSLALRHEHNIYKMGPSLWRALPMTYCGFLMGGLALIGVPPLAGFYSKEMILESVYCATQQGSGLALYAFYALLLGIIITSGYTSRLVFWVFHGSNEGGATLLPGTYRSRVWINIALLILMIATLLIGGLLKESVQMGYWLQGSVMVPNRIHVEWPYRIPFSALSLLLSVLGIVIAALYHRVKRARLLPRLKVMAWIHAIIAEQYGLTPISQNIIVPGIQWLARQCVRLDTCLIDRCLVQGPIWCIQQIGHYFQKLQSGYLQHYIFIMISSIMFILSGVMIRV